MGKCVFFTVFMLLSSLGFTINDDGVYLKIKAKKGDTIYGLLYNYRLHTNSCNSKAFYEINQLKLNDKLLAGKEYKIPVKVYKYDDKSIRTTTNNQNWDRALAIQEYNKLLKQEKVKTYYTDDMILFVPTHLDKKGCSVAQPKNAENTTPSTIKEPTKTTIAKEKEPQKDSVAVSMKKESVKEEEKPKVEDSKPAKKSTEKKYVKTDIYFGKNAKVELIDHSLKNQVFYVISGHGGPDPGAMKKKNGHQLCEDEYAYDVSIRLAKRLLQHGATVHMIIQDPNDGIRNESYLKLDRDEVCKLKGKIPLNQLKRLQQRVDAVNVLYKKEKTKGSKTHTMISIHVDSRSVGHEQDVFFYYAPKSSTGKQKALKLQQVFKQKYEKYQKGRGYEGSVSSRNLYVLRKSHPTAVFVELANIQNVYNHKRILPKENRQVLADWLYEGLIK